MEGRILITGGSGYLGRAILQRAQRDGWHATFTVYSRDEHKQDAVRERFPGVRTILGDVAELDRLTNVATGHDILIHAAALKYVPEAEKNVEEAVRVNIHGSMCVLRAAREAGVGRVVMVSTDKAVEPVNVYGQTKALMERLAVEQAQYPGPRITVARYGNVIGSTGSVVAKWRKAQAQGYTVPITDPTMTRFWMSADEAIDVLECALDSHARKGGTYVPAARSMTMADVASALGVLTSVVGTRPGEKKHESLIAASESTRCVPDAMRGGWCILPAWAIDASVPTPTPFTYGSNDPIAWLPRAEFRRLAGESDAI